MSRFSYFDNFLRLDKCCPPCIDGFPTADKVKSLIGSRKYLGLYLPWYLLFVLDAWKGISLFSGCFFIVQLLPRHPLRWLRVSCKCDLSIEVRDEALFCVSKGSGKYYV